MKVLIVGGGGREHALAWNVSRSAAVSAVWCAPGNAGIADCATCVPIAADDLPGLLEFARANAVDLTIVGPEQPLTMGIVDLFEQHGLRVFGPNRRAARLEGSKAFAKTIMRDAGIPTAPFTVCTTAAEAYACLDGGTGPVVVKADGLAAGKGVFPCRDRAAARAAVDTIMVDRAFGEAGDSVVIEGFLEGEEASFLCFTDGETIAPLPSAQDHKPVFDNDTGPNTGGMGAYSPAPVLTDAIRAQVMTDIMQPLVAHLQKLGITYRGIIYAGLMITPQGPQVLEFNVRFGDPETQPLLFRLQTDLVTIADAVIDGRLAACPITCDPRPAVCVVMAAGGYPGSYERGLPISGLEAAAAVDDVMVFHSGTTRTDAGVVTAGGRVLGVTARDQTVADAIARAYRAVSCISWDGVHYRTDIGRKALER